MESEKIKLYSAFIDAFMGSLQIKSPSRTYEKDITKFGILQQTHGLKMVVIASEPVVERFLFWRGLAQLEEKNYEAVFESFAKLIIAMRQDVVGSDARSYEDVLDILT